MKDTDIAWAAGFFDGEGSILLRKYTVKNHIQWTLRLVLVQKDPAPLYEFQTIVGGLGTVHRRETRPITVWEVASHEAEIALRTLYPYLRAKQYQADIALKFRETFRDYSTNRTGIPRKLPSEISSIRENLFDEMLQARRVVYYEA